MAHYERSQTSDNTTGHIVEMRMRLVSTEGGCGNGIHVENPRKNLTFGFFSNYI